MNNLRTGTEDVKDDSTEEPIEGAKGYIDGKLVAVTNKDGIWEHLEGVEDDRMDIDR